MGPRLRVRVEHMTRSKRGALSGGVRFFEHLARSKCDALSGVALDFQFTECRQHLRANLVSQGIYTVA